MHEELQTLCVKVAYGEVASDGLLIFPAWIQFFGGTTFIHSPHYLVGTFLLKGQFILQHVMISDDKYSVIVLFHVANQVKQLRAQRAAESIIGNVPDTSELHTLTKFKFTL